MKRIEVEPEPLPESKWSSIEQEVFTRVGARLATPRRNPVVRIAWLAAAAALVFVAGAALGARAWAPRSSPVPPPPAPTSLGSTRLDVDGVSIAMAPGAVVAVRGDDVALDQGEVEFGVPPREDQPPFVVSTPHARVESNGASFRVDVVSSRTDVQVGSGSARAIRPGATDQVGPGQTWSSSHPLPSVDAGAVCAPSASHGGRVVSPAPSANEPTPQARFEQAEALERSDPDRAVAQYDAIARGGGPWADNALFAEARLEADRGHRGDAKRLLTEYLTRYPTGPNAEDARSLLAKQGPW